MADLSHEQQAAVCHDGAHALVVAGPGSGKTRVIAERVRFLLESGVPASNIILLSFTRASAAEMEKRLREMGITGVLVSTIHALCLDILRREGGRIGYADAAKLVVRTDPEMADLATQAIESLAFEPKKITPKNVIKSLTGEVELKDTAKAENIRRCADKLRRMLMEGNGIGYRQIVPWATAVVFALSDSPVSVFAGKAEGPIHLLVDEGQDLSGDQWKFLTSMERTEDVRLFIVGDVDQSIYAFRGADPEAFLEYAKTVTTYHLKDNYRSDVAICDAANRLIEHNEKRVKGQRTEAVSKADGWAILHESDDLASESLAVADAIKCTTEGSVAVLSPTHARLDEVEKALKAAGIPCYRLAQQAQSEEFGRAMDLMRLVTRPDDDYLARRCTKAAFPDLTESALNLAAAFAAGKNLPLLSELAAGTNEMATWAEVVYAASRSNWKTAFAVCGSPDINQILSVFDEWSALNGSEDVRAFIGDLEAGEFQPGDVAKATGEGVCLSTIHGAKGLEWDTVFILGLEEGTLPRKTGDSEEQRRLAFVALTRARHTAILSRVRLVPDFSGNVHEAEPSRFIAECGMEVNTNG